MKENTECYLVVLTSVFRKRFFEVATWISLALVLYLASLVYQIYPKLKAEKPEGYPMVEPYEFSVAFASAFGCRGLKMLISYLGTPIFAPFCKD